VPELSPPIQAAVNQLAESLRPDADEPAEPRRSVLPVPPVVPPAPTLIGVPTVALARGRASEEPARRREFRRTDTLAVRAPTMRDVSVSARLLDRYGRPLTELPATSNGDACELRLSLGSLGPGDYVIELSARSAEESARQFVAFRVVR
jgi:hypothetical protein